MQATVLVIDDDIEMTEMLKLALEPEHFEVVATNSGEEGLALARKVKPDVMIVDLSMPRMDGFEVCREVRRFSNVPILILSAINKPAVIVQALDEGADDYLIKPINKPVLIAHINKIIRRAGANKQPVDAPSAYSR